MARLSPKIREQQILQAALEFAKREGWACLTRDAVAAEAECSEGLVSYYFGDFDNVRKEVMRYAVQNATLTIVAEGLLAGNRIAQRAPVPVKEGAAAWNLYQSQN